MTGKQLVNNLCYEYGTKNYNETRLKASQELKKDLMKLEKLKSILKMPCDGYIGFDFKGCRKIIDISEVKEWLEK